MPLLSGLTVCWRWLRPCAGCGWTGPGRARTGMMNAAARLPWELAGSKVREWHRDRLAVVYVRQSTMAQVIEHGESTRLQYGLSGRAAELGWEPSRILVIDEDLGHSASGAGVRPGVQRLVSEG